MATLREIRLRIKGVQNTQQITKAMKMVAAARLRRAQENVINARPYAAKIAQMLGSLITEDDRLNNPFILKREVKNVLVVVVTADRGLCGAFNTNIIREANKYVTDLREKENLNVSVYNVGKKGYDFFSRRESKIYDSKLGLFSGLKYEFALEITNKIVSSYLSGEFDKVVIVYNSFRSIISQKVMVEEFLPIPITEKSKGESIPDFIYEPDQKSIFNYILPKHLKAQFWKILLDSNAAELGARMTAMDNATSNAKELIRTLKITYNKARQASITKEILEIVSGANALRGS